MVSEGDLLRHRVPADIASHPWRDADEDIGSRPKRVAEVMSSQVLTSFPAEDVADVAQTMLDYSVRCTRRLDHQNYRRLPPAHEIPDTPAE